MATLIKEHRGFLILLIAATFVVYACTLWNGMFWDDNDFILNNTFVKDWQYVGRYFSDNVIAGAGFGSNYWRPLLLFVFSLEYHVWQAWAPGYHLVNMLVHTADAVLLFFILLRLFKNRTLAMLTSLVFSLHPVQTEAVSYANSLGDSLSVFWILLGIFLYQEGRLFEPLIFYGMALMTKETAIIMPGCIALVEFFSHESEHFLERIQIVGKKIWPYFCIAGFYILLRATALNFINTFNLYNEKNTFTAHIGVRILTFFKILTVYIRLLFWPVGLHMERSIGIVTSLMSPAVIVGAVLFAGLIFLAILSWKKYPVVSFGIWWFFVALVPTSNIIVPINGMLYEHWLYLPLVGFFLAIFWFVLNVTECLGKEKFFLCLGIIYFSFLGWRTIARNIEWRDPVRFYQQTLTYSPDSYRVRNNLGMAYAERHEDARAEESYRQAIAIDQKSGVAYYNLGNLLRDRGKIARAITEYEQAIRADPSFPYSYRALAGIYLDEKEYVKARDVLENYLHVFGDNANDLFLLFRIAREEGEYDAARGYLTRALRIDPGNPFLQKAYRDFLDGSRR